MKWTRIKDIMLYFLIAMNIFMLIFIAVTTMQQSVIPDKVINASIKVLQDSGFKCSKEIFPSSYYTLPTLDAQFYSASDLSDLFFGKQVAFSTEENSLVATEGYATLTVNSNAFTFDSGYTPDTSHSAKKVKRKLEKAGLDMEGAVYDEKSGRFYRTYNNTNLFDIYIEATLDSDGDICTVKAQWPKRLTAAAKKKISFVESTLKIAQAFPGGGTIKNIELVYSLHKSGGGKYIFNPSWRVLVNEEAKTLE